MTDDRWYPATDSASGAAPASGPTLFIATRKGLWFLRAEVARRAWWVTEPAFLGHIIQHAVLDPRDGATLLAATSTGHLGPTVFRSTDLGATWSEASRPPAFTSGETLGRSLRTVFWLTPGHVDEPGVWYAGGSPQGLFRSEDGGDTWAPVSGWNDHPDWTEWAEWPDENTPDGSLLHSVIVDPRDPAHLYIGMSAGGVFESTDGGTDWAPLNDGMATVFDPEPGPPFSHDPHCVRLHPARPDRLYQQNHCGIYRIDRPETTWTRIGNAMPGDVGDVGFSVEVHPRDPDVAWVLPMDGTDVWPRTSPDGRPSVYVTRDVGGSWTRLDQGLPSRGWLTVKRQATTIDDADPVGLYFGTTGGEVWGSVDEGAVVVADHAAPARDLRDRARLGGVNVRIPTPLRSYTEQRSVVNASGATVRELFVDLDRQFPGLRFRVVDEQDNIRKHMKVFVGDESVRDLDAVIAPDQDVTLMQALSGG